jgi:hypothetical protein
MRIRRLGVLLATMITLAGIGSVPAQAKPTTTSTYQVASVQVGPRLQNDGTSVRVKLQYSCPVGELANVSASLSHLGIVKDGVLETNVNFAVDGQLVTCTGRSQALQLTLTTPPYWPGSYFVPSSNIVAYGFIAEYPNYVLHQAGPFQAGSVR